MSPVLTLTVSILLKASLLLAAAAVAQAILRRRTSAATRHLLWTLAVASLLLLPALAVVLPAWTLPVPLPTLTANAPDIAWQTPVASQPLASRQEANERAVTASTRTTPSTPAPGGLVSTTSASSAPDGGARLSWVTALLMLYAAGALLLLLRLAVERFAVTRIARQATPMHDPEWRALLADCAERMQVDRPVRLLRSRDRTMPMTFGTRRPVILMPAIADAWPEDRQRAVLLHELAHVARRDCLTQMLAAIACAVYWMHPGVWWTARRLRIERELACDDRVLTVGTHARDYAGHLLEIAYSLGGGRAPALAVSMARPRQLEGRMLAVLDDTRNRTTPRLRGRLAGIGMTAALLLPLAGVEATVASVSATSAAGTVSTVSADQALYPSAPAAPSAPARAVRSSGVASADSTAHHASASLDSPAITATDADGEPAPRQGTRDRSAQSGASANPQDRLPGTWEVRPATEPAGSVHVRLTEISPDGGNWSSGTTMPLDKLEGLTQTQIAGATGPVTFKLQRDAGTFTFEGMFRNGVGAGTYTFAANPAFPAELAKRNISRPTAAEQYELARGDIGLGFVDELTTQGYQRPELGDLVRAGQHGVHLEYLKAMGGLGYRLGFLDALIKQRDHGITAQFIRELAADGFQHLSPEEILRVRDHGVSPDYLHALRDAGYRSLSLDQAVNARDHGVSADFIREMGAQGYTRLSLEELTNARDHGVSASYARELKELGYTVTLADMIKARDHGVTPDFIRDLTASGYGKLTVDELIRVRDHGVSAKYARDLKDLGYDHVALSDLIELRNHGVTAERIRTANARAGTHLPLDMIKALADGGLR
jgi:beta-lactamase regulating signal transducer with metallopeptidase domain